MDAVRCVVVRKVLDVKEGRRDIILFASNTESVDLLEKCVLMIMSEV